jgi:hypothetical protein
MLSRSPFRFVGSRAGSGIILVQVLVAPDYRIPARVTAVDLRGSDVGSGSGGGNGSAGNLAIEHLRSAVDTSIASLRSADHINLSGDRDASSDIVNGQAEDGLVVLFVPSTAFPKHLCRGAWARGCVVETPRGSPRPRGK